jgi:phenylpropionate dioxygenase-like ring-hydroxylating dioxygenase large terminal subunit
VTVTYDTPDTTGGQPRYQLPPSAYFDPAWYEREKLELFGRAWNLVGHQVDLPDAGSFLTAVVGTEPIVVVRKDDGSLTGYVNVCRHRGMTIVQGEGESCTGTCGESLRCPYHGWEWDLGGALVRVPQRKTQFPDLDTETLGLFPVAVASWAGLIFVHPDPTQADTFDEWLGDFPLRSGDFPWDDLVQVRRVRTPLKCNWKLYIENHIDWLHLWYLHEESLGMYDHPNGEIWEIGDHFASAERLRKDKERPQADGLIEIPGMAPEEEDLLRANLLFPNVPFVTVPTGFSSYQVIPTGPETCELDFRLFGLPGSDIADEALAYNMLILVDEDGGACEQMQASIHSPHFQVGPLATEFERPIAHFHDGVIRFMGAP